MKRIYTLIALFALVAGLTGCDQGANNNPPPADTNAVPAAVDTNAPAK